MTRRPTPQTREEQAKLEIGHTQIDTSVKWTLCLMGLFTLFAVPAVQVYRDLCRRTQEPCDSLWPQCCRIFYAVPQAVAAHRAQSGSQIAKIVRGNADLRQSIDRYEQDLKGESFLTQVILPPTQEFLIYVGSGNEKAYVGRERWLFYRPGIDYCTGPGFLDPWQMARRGDQGRVSQASTQPDPRKAILQFHRQLAQRNIRLVLMPTPDKATIHPEKFSSRYAKSRLSIHNPSYPQLLAELESEGVLVCDVTDALAAHRDRTGQSVYLATDTHWRPEAMALAAAELARFIDEQFLLEATAKDRAYFRESCDIRNLGDIAKMINLRRNQGVLAEEVVTIHRVSDATGGPWRPNPTADILVLGDSFANIYSLEMMNWGGAAGLVEQLSFALQRPVDTILRNDDGAYATREILSRELAQGEDRLAGKKVLVWQFAARELAVGDWKLLNMTLAQSRRPTDNPPSMGDELIVSGTVAAKSAAPRAGQIPYAHHIFTLDLTNLQVHRGSLSEPKIAVYLFSLRNHQNTSAFAWPIGTRVKLKLQPWRPDMFRKYGRINRSETNDPELKTLWWGEMLE